MAQHRLTDNIATNTDIAAGIKKNDCRLSEVANELVR